MGGPLLPLGAERHPNSRSGKPRFNNYCTHIQNPRVIAQKGAQTHLSACCFGFRQAVAGDAGRLLAAGALGGFESVLKSMDFPSHPLASQHWESCLSFSWGVGQIKYKMYLKQAEKLYPESTQ